eukprot:GHVR01184426.1.p1 GENE.GHVR01184426.1~~GHVR01184426.1.p1  ORF type:complete len:530 (-),score=105.52 GHVR01184426.1:343-1932(-)
MGRDPSHEVMECALQTHPNVVIIAEEYGAADKTLIHIVQDIADVVARRADQKKNFGTVLIPEGLLLHLPNMRNLITEIAHVVKDAEASGSFEQFREAMENIEIFGRDGNEWVAALTPWSLALFKSFPKFIRREFLTLDNTEMKFTHIETEELLAQMVKQELDKRATHGRYTGKFQAVTHFFGYQGRSSLPSVFDSQLGFAHGHLAGILVESGLSGYCTTVRGLCGPPSDWKFGAVPFTSMMKVLPRTSDIDKQGMDIPLIPSAEVNLESRSFRYMKNALEHWESQDRFCNPGPMQFYGPAALYYNRTLHEEQAEYLLMLRHVESYTKVLHDTCRFGVDENFLKTAFCLLNSLLTLRLHPDDVLRFGLPLPSDQVPASLRRPDGQRSPHGRSPGQLTTNFAGDNLLTDGWTMEEDVQTGRRLLGGGHFYSPQKNQSTMPTQSVIHCPAAPARSQQVNQMDSRGFKLAKQGSLTTLGSLSAGGSLPQAPWASQQGALNVSLTMIQGHGHSEKNTPGVFNKSALSTALHKNN